MAKVLKWLGIFVILLFAVILVIYIKGMMHLGSTWEVKGTITSVPSDSVIIARGQHLANINGCTDCHGSDLSGKVFLDIPPFLAVASNLTSGKGGVALNYDDSGWDKAMRHGVKSDGTGMIVMPSKAFSNISDKDTESIIAYIKSLPPVDNELPSTEYRFLGTMLAGAGEIDLADYIVTEATPKSAPEPDSTEVYGGYLANITCSYCHGQDFTGGPGESPGETIPGLQTAMTWGFDGFEKLLRTGKKPDGTEVGEMMPWRAFSHFTHSEMIALYKYLQNYK